VPAASRNIQQRFALLRRQRCRQQGRSRHCVRGVDGSARADGTGVATPGRFDPHTRRRI